MTIQQMSEVIAVFSGRMLAHPDRESTLFKRAYAST
jgi:hypothetical protein